jgi:hypothetical protein
MRRKIRELRPAHYAQFGAADVDMVKRFTLRTSERKPLLFDPCTDAVI